MQPPAVAELSLPRSFALSTCNPRTSRGIRVTKPWQRVWGTVMRKATRTEQLIPLMAVERDILTYKDNTGWPWRRLESLTKQYKLWAVFPSLLRV